MAKRQSQLKKILLHPTFAVLTPIVLALLILVFLIGFGGRYDETPFIYGGF